MAETLAHGEAISLGDVIADAAIHPQTAKTGEALAVDRGKPRDGPAPEHQGIRGDFEGALSANGQLYCPKTPCCCSASARCAGEPRARDGRAQPTSRRALQIPALPVAAPMTTATSVFAARRWRTKSASVKPASMSSRPSARRAPAACRPTVALSCPADDHRATTGQQKTRQKHAFLSAARAHSMRGARPPSALTR